MTALNHLFKLISKSLDERLSLSERRHISGKILSEDATEEKQIRELIRKELDPMLKKHFSTRPILSKVEIERIVDAKVKKEIATHPDEKQVRLLIRQALVNQYHWFWDKRNTWVNQI